MNKFYYRIPNGVPTIDLASLIPSVINPQFLSASELLEYNVAECQLIHPIVEWWETLGDRIVDDSDDIHVITWEVIERDLEEVKSIAWERIQEKCIEIKEQGFTYEYPDESTGHVDVGQSELVRILALHSVATTLVAQGNTEEEIPWIDVDGHIHVMNPEDSIEFTMEAFTLCSEKDLTSRNIRQEINESESVSEVVAAAVWPGDE